MKFSPTPGQNGRVGSPSRPREQRGSFFNHLWGANKGRMGKGTQG